MAIMAQLSMVALAFLSTTAGVTDPPPADGQLEWRSLAVGFGLGLLVALVLWVLRDRMVAASEALRARTARLRARLSRRGIDRYRNQMIELAERGHLLHHHATLSEIYVPRRLLVPGAVPPALQRAEDDQDGGSWSAERMVELMHPASVSVTLKEAMRQQKRLAILGTTGSGRTTLLHHMALLYARRVGWRLSFPEPSVEDAASRKAARRREQERLPVLIPLQVLDLSSVHEGGRNALVRPIITHLAASPYHAIAAYVGSMVRSRLLSGDCLLLFDNLDLLDPERRGQVLGWIGELAQAYPDNVMVIAGAVEGYAALAKMGFPPLVLDTFVRLEVERFVEQWERIHDTLDASELEDRRTTWQAILEQTTQGLSPEDLAEPPAEPPVAPELSLSVLDAWPAGRREGVLPVDLALAAILWRQGQPVPAKAAARCAQAVIAAIGHVKDRLLTPPQWAHVLGSVAWSMQVEGQHQEAQSLFEQAVADLLDETYVAAADLRAAEDDEKPGFSRESRSAVLALVAAGDLLTEVERRRIAFVHPIYRAYFAAQHAARANQEPVVRAHVRDPQWQHTVRSYAALSNPAALVKERLQGTDDLFRSDFFAGAGDVAASTNIDERLRAGLLSELAQILLDPKHCTPMCQLAAKTIVQFQDDGALYLFGKAIAHQDPQVRRVGVWGLSLVEGKRALAGLQHALSDPDHLVRIEALYAIAGRHGEATVDGLVQGLQDEHELTRRVAAELLAVHGGDGHDLLREAADVEDMYIRRAAVFGLGVVGEPWALRIVDRVQREDGEWFVRSAAAEVMERTISAQPVIIPDAVRPELADWLIHWASEQGVPCTSPDEAGDALLQAMRQGAWRIKVAAADLLRACGGRQAIPVLKSALRDERLLVREAAFAALREISQRIGLRIPA
jgi:HEAT repeat protein